MGPQHLSDPPKEALDQAFARLASVVLSASNRLEDFHCYMLADELQDASEKVEALLYPDTK